MKRTEHRSTGSFTGSTIRIFYAVQDKPVVQICKYCEYFLWCHAPHKLYTFVYIREKTNMRRIFFNRKNIYTVKCKINVLLFFFK